jgi:proline iminopeptidase
MRAGHASVDGAELYYRDIGHGPPLVVIHGGPDFDHTYLLPDLDRLAEAYRLIYYDQRGRGKSRGAVRLDDIHIDTYVADLDGLRRHLGLDTIAVLGHSWGGLIAMHYALRHPDRASHLVLMNSIPASHADLQVLRRERLRRREANAARFAALMPGYARGDPEAVAEYYRIDYGATFKRPGEAARLNLDWTREDILTGRAIEERLMQGLVWADGYTLIPVLATVRTPTLVIHGDFDFVPLAASVHIAEAIPGARLAILGDSGHFSYIDAPGQVRKALDDFFAQQPGPEMP